MLKILFIFIMLIPIFSTGALAEESADELFRNGRFAEAEKAYANLDMDKPKDIRHRYNRGVAAYHNQNYQGAVGAFSSVLRRVKDNQIRFRAAYNLGNTAYLKGEFESAVTFFKQAILFKPSNEDAAHNLELALRALEKQKKEKKDNHQKDPRSDSQKHSPKHDRQDKSGQDSEKNPGDEEAKKGKPQDKEQNREKDQAQTEDKTESDQKEAHTQNQPSEKKSEESNDLKGELKLLEDVKEKEGEEAESDKAISMMDKKKAEALLDNIKEDRTKFLRFQIPEEKRHGVSSGKDW